MLMNTPDIRNKMHDNSAITFLMQHALYDKASYDILIESLVHLIRKKTFVMLFVQNLDIFELLHQLYNTYKDNRVISILCNVMYYADEKQVEDFIIPLLNASGINNADTITLFSFLINNPRCSTQMFSKKYKWMFNDLNKILQDNSTNEIVLRCLYEFFQHRERQKNVFSKFCDEMFKSECRLTLFWICTQNGNQKHYAENILLSIFIHNSYKNTQDYYLSKQEQHYIEILLTSSSGFVLSLLNCLRGPMLVQSLTYTSLKRLSEACNGLSYIILVSFFFAIFPYDETEYNEIFLNMASCPQHFRFNLNDGPLKHLQILKKIGVDAQISGKTLQLIDYIINERQRESATMLKLQAHGVQNFEYPQEFKCPITQDVMRDPVVASDGHSYERNALEKLMNTRYAKSPLTREKLTSVKIPNINLKKRIRDYAEEICEVLDKKQKNCDSKVK